MINDIGKKLSTVDPDGLTKHQRQAVNAMLDWFNSPELEFTLKGYAGTGKTYVVATFLKTHGLKINYCVTAPTHKALHVIEQKIGRKGKTLHSLHGLRMNVDLLTFNIENPQFDPLGEKHIQNYKLVVIDEASMINSSLFELNREASNFFKTKILYVGDPLQLPPVKEEVGKVFTDVTNSFELTEIVRQDKDHDLVELFEMLRNDIINNTNDCVNHLIKSRDKKVANDYLVLSSVPYKKEILKYFCSDEFTKNIDYIRQGCYTRNAVTRWNNFIRMHVVGQDKDILDIHDILTAYSNQLDSFKNPIISNSEDYILKDIDTYVDNIGLHTFSVNLQSMINLKRSPKLLILNHTDEASLKKFTAALNYLHYEASVKRVPGGFKNYYNFKNAILTMTDIKLNEDNSNKTVGKDLDYGYALTIHKLQGSTMKNIAIDLRDILYPNGINYPSPIEIRNRLLYVGLSRTTEKAIIHY
jgi:hypothetical protein